MLLMVLLVSGDGKWIMNNEIIKTIDEKMVINESIKRSKEIIERSKIKIPKRFKYI